MMTSLLERYTTDLLNQAAFPPGERENVESKLRAHVQKKVEHAIAQGTDRESAEFEMFLALVPNHFFLFRYPNDSRIQKYVFEKLATGFFFLAFVGTGLFITSQGDMSPAFAIGFFFTTCLLMGGGFLLGEISSIIHVFDGTIRLRQLFRVTQSREISQIESVSSQRSWMLFYRNIIFQFPESNIVSNIWHNGLESVLVLVDAQNPEKLDSRAKEYLEDIRPRIRRENPLLRLILALLWVAGFLLYLYGLPFLWRLEGVSLFLLPSLGLAGICMVGQLFFHRERAKAALLWLSGSLLFLLNLFVFSFSWGGIGFTHWVVTLWLLLFLHLGLVLLWRGRPRLLGMVVCISLLAGVSSRNLFVLPWEGKAEEWAADVGIGKDFQWIEDGSNRIVYIEDPYDEPSSLVIVSATGEFNRFELGRDDWKLLPPFSPHKLALEKSSGGWGEREYQIFLHDLSGNQELLSFDREISPALYSPLFETFHWSPERETIFLRESIRDSSGEVECIPALGRLSTGKVDRIKDFGPMVNGSWISNTEARIIGINGSLGSEFHDALNDASFDLHHFDLPTGMETHLCHFELEPTTRARLLPGAEFALLLHGDFLEWRKYEERAELLDLSDGSTTPIPPVAWANINDDLYHFWSSEASVLVYPGEVEGRPHLIAANKQGVIAAQPIPPNEVIGGISVSPDGKKAVFDSYDFNETVSHSFIQVQLWDIESNESATVQTGNSFGLFLDFFKSSPVGPQIELAYILQQLRWSPDSGRFAFSPIAAGLDFNSPLLVYEVEDFVPDPTVPAE